MRLGVPVLFCRCSGPWENTHGVPADVVERMRGELECLTVETCLTAERPEPAAAPVPDDGGPIFGLDFI